MNYLKNVLGIVLILIFSNTLTTPDKENSRNQILTPSYHLHNVIFTGQLRQKFSQFIDNVLQQIPSQQLFDFIDETMPQRKSPYSDKDFYTHLCNNAKHITPSFGFYHQFKALAHQKNILGDQIKKLIGSSVVTNIAEIGTPGTYSTHIKKNSSPITGTIYAIHDKQRLSDIAQATSFNPFKKFVAYDQFVNLHEYDPISQNAIASNSVDVVLCTIGLHHIPLEKLDAFISSIRRILKPNGTFILREHDVTNDDLKSIVYAAHSIFNIIMNQDSLETELAEYRNFQSLDYWIKIMKGHGFNVGSERILQPGDPTLNTMLKFTKIAQTQEEKEQEIVSILHKNKDYVRDNMQTYLTSPEWLNVDTSQEYSKFINHTPFYEYPYIQNTKAYWKVFYHSCRLAAQKKGKFAVLTSPYTTMNLFIGAMMSLEYGAKSLISLPIRWMNSGIEPATIQLLIKDPQQELTILKNRITVLEQYPKAGMQLIEIPRYKEFLDIMLKLADTHITIVEIAGNKDIQLKLGYYTTSGNNSPKFEIPGCKKLYTWHLETKPNYTYMTLEANVEYLRDVINYCHKNAVDILYIHDF